MSVVFDLQRFAEMVHRRCVRLGETLYGYGLFQVEVTRDAYRLLWGSEHLGDYSTVEQLDAAVESLLDRYRKSFQGPEAPADGYRSVWRRLLAVSRNHPGGGWIPLAELAPMFGGNTGLGYALSRLRAEKHLSFTGEDGVSWRLSLGTATRVYQTGKYRSMRVWTPTPGGTGDFYATFKMTEDTPVRSNVTLVKNLEFDRENAPRSHPPSCRCLACGVTQQVLPQKMLTNAQHDLLGQIGEVALKVGYLYAWMIRIPSSPTLDQTRDRHTHYKNELDKLVTKARRARIAGDLIERRVQAGYITGESDFRCGRNVDTDI